MNFLKNLVLSILFVVWFVFAFAATVYLLSYNDYSIAKIGDYYLIIADSDELGDDFKEGDLIVVKRDKNKNINKGDDVFLARPGLTNQNLINLGKVERRDDVTSKESTFVINGIGFSSEYILGKTASSRVVPKLGSVVSIVSSRLGFMFCIIFPTLFVMVYEIMAIVEEVRAAKD